MRSISENGNNSSSYVSVYRKLVLSSEGTNLSDAINEVENLLSFNEKIFGSPSTGKAFLYLCLHGAATGWILQSELDMPEATVYRALNRMKELGIITPSIKVSKARDRPGRWGPGSRDGPKPMIWALPGATMEEVSRALKLHFRILSPQYRIGEEAAQTIMDEFIKGREVQEISYNEILVHVKEMKVPFRAPDIADIAADCLLEGGIKVWR